MNPNTNLVELDKLIGLFYAETAELGRFRSLPAEQVSEPSRSLLAHEMHMTVTVEKFHSSAVQVDVIQEQKLEQSYSREICLKRVSDGVIVQYGIVRLNFQHLDDEVQREIEGKGKPLGRILIDHDVLRRVQLLSLYAVTPAQQLKSKIGANEDTLYGRTAIIYCNNEPAIELLEIVTV